MQAVSLFYDKGQCKKECQKGIRINSVKWCKMETEHWEKILDAAVGVQGDVKVPIEGSG